MITSVKVLVYTGMCPPCYHSDGKTAHGNTVDNSATKLHLGESRLNYLPDLYTCNIRWLSLCCKDIMAINNK